MTAALTLLFFVDFRPNLQKFPTFTRLSRTPLSTNFVLYGFTYQVSKMA